MNKKNEIVVDSLKKLSDEKKGLIMQSIITVQKMRKGGLNESDDEVFEMHLDDLGLTAEQHHKINSELHKSPKKPEDLIKILSELDYAQKRWLVVEMNICAMDDKEALRFAISLAANIGINRDEYSKIIDEEAKKILDKLMSLDK